MVPWLWWYLHVLWLNVLLGGSWNGGTPKSSIFRGICKWNPHQKNNSNWTKQLLLWGQGKNGHSWLHNPTGPRPEGSSWTTHFYPSSYWVPPHSKTPVTPPAAPSAEAACPTDGRSAAPGGVLRRGKKKWSCNTGIGWSTIAMNERLQLLFHMKIHKNTRCGPNGELMISLVGNLVLLIQCVCCWWKQDTTSGSCRGAWSSSAAHFSRRLRSRNSAKKRRLPASSVRQSKKFARENRDQRPFLGA